MGEGNKAVQYEIAYAVALTNVANGATTTWPAPVMPKFQNNETDFHVTPTEMSWMVAMGSVGFMVGGFLSRFVTDWFGRRMCILSSAAPGLAGTIIVICANQARLLFLTRFLWGIGCGLCIPVIPLYMAEIADKRYRGSLTLVTRFMFNFGNLLIMCIGPVVSYSTLNYLLLILPLIYFAASLWIPESPFYCLKVGNVDGARKVLARIRVYEDEMGLENDLNLMQEQVKIEMRSSSTYKELFTGKKYRKAVIIAFGLRITQVLTGQMILGQYLGLIIIESRTDIKLSSVFIIFGAVRFVTSVMSSSLVDRVGRRPLLIFSFLGAGICLIIIGIYFFLLEVLQCDPHLMKSFSCIPFIGIICCTVISNLGYFSLLAVVPAEIFPLNVKAIALTSLGMLAGVLNFILARGYQVLKDAAGLCGVFYFVGAFGIVGSIFTALYVPETKGKSLKEIQKELQGELYEAGSDQIRSRDVALVTLDPQN